MQVAYCKCGDGSGQYAVQYALVVTQDGYMWRGTRSLTHDDVQILGAQVVSNGAGVRGTRSQSSQSNAGGHIGLVTISNGLSVASSRTEYGVSVRRTRWLGQVESPSAPTNCYLDA